MQILDLALSHKKEVVVAFPVAPGPPRTEDLSCFEVRISAGVGAGGERWAGVVVTQSWQVREVPWTDLMEEVTSRWGIEGSPTVIDGKPGIQFV
jgi:hypothetical protein